MELRLALAQTGYPQDGDVLAQAETYVKKAHAEHANILAFPEYYMCSHACDPQELRAIAQSIDGDFARSMASLAQQHGLFIAYTMIEKNPLGELPYNTSVLVNPQGGVLSHYRKCHLYDAHAVRESGYLGAGDLMPQVARTPFGDICLAICYDLRFPEVARVAALQGCDLMIFPAAWYDGPHKAGHWQTLLRARAIENEMFVAGVCRAGQEFVGGSLIADPLGTVITESAHGVEESKAEKLVVCTIDMTAVKKAREAMPVLEHRRPELYR
ncbi:MAG: carbon-nitrogen hydrolase family protein [Coriobacteriales bacterium]|nr:carbon-nitrogen hydrolase family protein [Coriobacteriales bacterium]